jgi:arylsulfatase A-like enzyme
LTRDETKPRGWTAAALIALAALLGCRSGGADARPRDIVLVVFDALRADRLAALGSARATAPNADRLGDDAVVYERATSPATWCVPAHASLLTGRWPSYHGAERIGAGPAAQPIDPRAPTLAELLRPRVKRTAAFVGLRDELLPSYGFARGFDEFRAEPELGAADELGRAAARWLEQNPEPAFLLVALPAPRVRDGWGAGPQVAVDAAAAAARYDEDVTAADNALGKIVAALKAQGRYDDALVVVTSDHGLLLGEHALTGAGRAPFEPEIRVPLFVKYPHGRRAAERVPRRVSTLGVFATVLAESDVALPAGVQSRELDELHPVWVEDLDASGRRMRAGYDGADIKLIALSDRSNELACSFDLSTDPGEMRGACAPDAAPLRVAMGSFSHRPRPASRGGVDDLAADDSMARAGHAAAPEHAAN